MAELKEALLYEKLSGKKVRCRLCARYCTIADGALGWCACRENRGGTLYSLTYGKSTGFAVDPIEKKPFFHFKPGTQSLSFGTPGCNMRCKYCFLPGTAITTDEGVVDIEKIFETGTDERLDFDGVTRKITNKSAITQKGSTRNITHAFKHDYTGEIIVVKPHHLPEIKCTPYHEFFVRRNGKIVKLPAGEVTEEDYTVVPKTRQQTEIKCLDAKKILSEFVVDGRNVNRTAARIIDDLIKLHSQGFSSRKIGAELRINPAYVRNIMSKIRRFGKKRFFSDQIELIEHEGQIRIKREKSDGIPRFITVDDKLATLFGYYCAEGCVQKFRGKPNYYMLVFNYAPQEEELVEDTRLLLKEKFDVDAKIMKTRTTVRVYLGNSSLALFFKALCGSGAASKRVPTALMLSPPSVSNAFLAAYNKSNGWSKGFSHPISLNAVSKNLAFGVYWLFTRIGILPAFYKRTPDKTKKIEGHLVSQSPLYCVKVYSSRRRKNFEPKLGGEMRTKKQFWVEENDDYFFVKIHRIRREFYAGPVYNLEVEGDHSYLAGFASVGNCQNWFMSQAPKEVEKAFDIHLTSPERVAKMAMNTEGVAYTYSEPTIFFEYARDCIIGTRKLEEKEKTPEEKRRYHVFVTNGYFSKECFDLIVKEKLIDAMRIDLKSFNDRVYQEVSSSSLKPVLESIKRVHQSKIHLEVICLIIPTLSDKPEEIREMCKWIAGLSKNIPVHFLRFFPYYQMTHLPPTEEKTLLLARDIAREEGLNYIYIGNTFLEGVEDTYCAKCGELLIARSTLQVTLNKIKDKKNPRCPSCGMNIPIIF